MPTITAMPRRIKRLWAEIDYAQRRSFELQTGIPLTGSREPSPAQRRQIAELEAAYTLPRAVDCR